MTKCRATCHTPVIWRRGRLPVLAESPGVSSSSILSKSLGIFQTWTRWAFKSVRANGLPSFLRLLLSYHLLLDTRHTISCGGVHLLLHFNGILRPTARLVLTIVLFRSVGPSMSRDPLIFFSYAPPSWPHPTHLLFSNPPDPRAFGEIIFFTRDARSFGPIFDAEEESSIIHHDPRAFETRGYKSCLHSSQTSRSALYIRHAPRPVYLWLSMRLGGSNSPNFSPTFNEPNIG